MKIYEISFKVENISGKIIFDEPVSFEMANRYFNENGLHELGDTVIQEPLMDFIGTWLTSRSYFVHIFGKSGDNWVGEVVDKKGDRIGIASFDKNGENNDIGNLMSKKRGPDDSTTNWPPERLIRE